MREIIKEVLSKLAKVQYTGDPGLVKSISDEIRDKIKDLQLPKYKVFVHVVIGEIKGQGLQMSQRCFWDNETDNFVSENIKNETLFAVATAYGIYQY